MFPFPLRTSPWFLPNIWTHNQNLQFAMNWITKSKTELSTGCCIFNFRWFITRFINLLHIAYQSLLGYFLFLQGPNSWFLKHCSTLVQDLNPKPLSKRKHKHLAKMDKSDIEPVLSKESLGFQATMECKFTCTWHDKNIQSTFICLKKFHGTIRS